MDRVWDICKSHPGLSVSTFQAKDIPGDEVKKVKLKILGLGDAIHVFSQAIRQEHDK